MKDSWSATNRNTNIHVTTYPEAGENFQNFYAVAPGRPTAPEKHPVELYVPQKAHRAHRHQAAGLTSAQPEPGDFSVSRSGTQISISQANLFSYLILI